MPVRFRCGALAILALSALAACRSLPDASDFRRTSFAPRGIAPESLIRRSIGDVRTLLGNPSLVRTEAPAEIWQYADEGSVLDVVFYPDRDFGMISAYLECRSMEGRKIDATICLTDRRK